MNRAILSLPSFQTTGIRSNMKVRFVSLLLLLAVLIGTVVMPETGHAEGMLARHASEVLNIEDHVDAATEQHNKQGSNVPCHAVVHHHCSIAIKTDAEITALGVWSVTSLIMPQTVYPLTSLGSAPLTEPPAA